jgi:hypothetical protein
MSAQILLPGRAEPLDVPDPGWAAGYPAPTRRSVYAAAHVAANLDGSIDWDATMRFRSICGDTGSASPKRWILRNAARD